MTRAAQTEISFAKKIIAKIFMDISVRVRVFGWARRLASRLTIESTMRLPPAPIRPVMACRSWGVLLLVMHRCETQDLEGSSSRRYLDFNGLAFALVQKAAADGRGGRDQAGRRIGVFAR